MAHIYYGNKRRFEENLDVAQAAACLSDDFWCLFEFDIPMANIDCLIIRAVESRTTPEVASTFLLNEIKHVTGRLRGLEYGEWSIIRNGIEEPYASGNDKDVNPWAQTLRALNLFKDWFAANHTVFLSDGRYYAADDIKIWPYLLIVRNDSDERHQLPTSPSNKFGSMMFSLDQWLHNVQNWQPRVGIQLTHADADGLVRTLGLNHWQAPDLPPELPEVGSPVQSNWLDQMSTWIASVERRLTMLEQRASTSGQPRE
jgi:hypothetical protein